MEDGVAELRPSISSFKRQLVHRHNHVGKIAHEFSRDLGNCRSSDRRRSVVYAQRTALGEKRGDAFRILAAPRLGIALSERGYLSEIIHARISGMALINLDEAFANHNARTPDPRCLNAAVRLLGTSQ